MSKDYTSTLNLPVTDFPMRANLPQREPEMLKYWDEIAAVLGSGLESAISGIVTLVIVVAILIYMIRGFFR